MVYYTYIVECSDKTYYCGYTTDLASRVREHNFGVLGAKYTKSRRPVKLIYREEQPSKSLAMKREYEIKSMTRKQKELLVKES